MKKYIDFIEANKKELNADIKYARKNPTTEGLAIVDEIMASYKEAQAHDSSESE